MSYSTGCCLGIVAPGVAYVVGQQQLYSIPVIPQLPEGGADPVGPSGGLSVTILGGNPGLQPTAGDTLICRKTPSGWVAERMALVIECGPLLGYQGAVVNNAGVVWGMGGPGNSSAVQTVGGNGVAVFTVHREGSYSITITNARLVYPTGTFGPMGNFSSNGIALACTARSDQAVAGQIATGPLPGVLPSGVAWTRCYPLPINSTLKVDVGANSNQSLLYGGGNFVWPTLGSNTGFSLDCSGSAPALSDVQSDGTSIAYTLVSHTGPASVGYNVGLFTASFTGPKGAIRVHE